MSRYCCWDVESLRFRCAAQATSGLRREERVVGSQAGEGAAASVCARSSLLKTLIRLSLPAFAKCPSISSLTFQAAQHGLEEQSPTELAEDAFLLVGSRGGALPAAYLLVQRLYYRCIRLLSLILYLFQEQRGRAKPLSAVLRDPFLLAANLALLPFFLTTTYPRFEHTSTGPSRVSLASQ